MVSNLIQIQSIKDVLEASVLAGDAGLDETVAHIYASDLMSDVLAFGKPDSILLTGLATRQSVISAHMAEFKGVVFIRGKIPKDGSDIFAKDKNLVLLTTKMDMYDACVRINSMINKSKDIDQSNEEIPEEILLKHEFSVQGMDFANAGMASTELKSILKKIGFPPELVRRVAISTYEGELNIIMHATQGEVILSVTPKSIEVLLNDKGPGIPDIEMAMEEGFTTATEEMRAMGFGSGMGLPNIKRNSDELDIQSEVGQGTKVRMRFYT
jgi:serine/threonine-protein kinase RsbT